jgi:hypothetical protein
MAKIHFDSDVVDKKINPNVSNAKGQLSTGRKYLNEVYIPWDFVYRNTLKGYIGNIDTINRQLDTFYNWINDTKTKMEQAEQGYKNTVEKIEVEEIKERPKIV